MSEVVKKKGTGVSLKTLAAEINEEHRRCEESFKAGLRHALRAGELLTEAKSRCKHGEWGAWLKENFEGSERTAQAYMKVYRERSELEGANPQRAADLSYREALKELAAPSEPKTPAGGDEHEEKKVHVIRGMMGAVWGELWSDAEREALEKRLGEPGPEEDELLNNLVVEALKELAAQVAVDGFLLEEGAEDGERVMSYRSADKRRIYYVPLPAGEEHAERVERGCNALAISNFKMWRVLGEWFTKVLLAHSDDLDAIERRVRHNADWRQAEPAADYLYDELYGRADERRSAVEAGMSVKEFRETVGAVKLWVDIQAHHFAKNLLGRTGAA